MKFLTLLLATTILYLAIMPGVNLILLQTNTEQSCCNETCNEESNNEKTIDQQKKRNDCNGKSCNPFQSCCTSVLYCKTNRPIEILKPEISIEQNFNYTSTFTSQYAPDFWQPPKVV